MTNEELKEILSKTTTTIPKAREALGFKSRNASYAAAQAGKIKYIDMGHIKPVPTSWLRQVLGLDPPAA